MMRGWMWIGACILACSGCDDEEPAPAVADGLWTSPIASLTVTGGKVVSFRLEQVSCATVNPDPMCGGVAKVTIDDAEATIDDGAFTLERPWLVVSGAFDGDEAIGTWTFHDQRGCCDLEGSWHAVAPLEDLECTEDLRQAPAEAEIELGTTDDAGEQWTALAEGASLDVVMGFQGFKMAVVAVRQRHLPLEAQTVTVEVTSEETGALLADFQLKHPEHSAQPDGSAMIAHLPLVVTATDDAFVDQPALARVEIRNDCGLSAEAPPVEVVLRKRF